MKAILTIPLVLLLHVPGFSQTPPQADSNTPALAVSSFLGFSEGQTVQFLEILDEFHTAMRNLQPQIESKHRQLEGLLTSSQPSPISVGQTVIEIRALEMQGGQIVATYHNAFVAILTPEQLQKVQVVVQASGLIPAIGAFAAVQLVEAPPAR